MLKNCDECGTEFQTDTQNFGRGVRRFCGKQCASRYSNRRVWAKGHPPKTEDQLRRQCVSCGREFIADRAHPKSLTCSQRCSQQRINAVRKNSREKDLTFRCCLDCGTEFVAGAMRTKKFCTPKCQQRFNGRLYQKRNKNLWKERNRKYRWGGNWNAALERDERKCVKCGSEKNPCVHHIDGTGEHENPNHDLDNLATLCPKCHKQIHTLTYRIADGIIYIDGPVFDWLGVHKVRIEILGKTQ